MLILGSHQTILFSEVSLLIPYGVKWNSSGFPVLIENIVQVLSPFFEISSSLFIRTSSTTSTSTATYSSSSLFATGSTILPSSPGLFIVTSTTWTSVLRHTRIKFYISGSFLKRVGLSLNFCQLADSCSGYFTSHLSLTHFINILHVLHTFVFI